MVDAFKFLEMMEDEMTMEMQIFGNIFFGGFMDLFSKFKVP